MFNFAQHIKNEVIEVIPEKIPSMIESLKKCRIDKIDVASSVKTEKDKSDLLIRRILVAMFCNMGLENNMTLETFMSKAHIKAEYKKWLKGSLIDCSDYNLLSYDAISQSIILKENENLQSLWREWEKSRERKDEFSATGDAIDVVLRAVPDILVGKAIATDVIFNNSSFNLVEKIYSGNKIVDYYNEVLVKVLETYVKNRVNQDAHSSISILEIGAGTGSTSKLVLEMLKRYNGYIEEYCYTDLSKSFLINAKRTFGKNIAYLDYKVVNIEEDLEKQGIEAGKYDIVIATNVLHATKNMAETIKNAKYAMKKNGLLFLNEISSFTLFNHLIFGMLEGWWLYEDKAIRLPNTPALTPEAWEMLLQTEGFNEVIFPCKEAHSWGQQIIVAESNGAIRRNNQTTQREVVKPKTTQKIVKAAPTQKTTQVQKAEKQVDVEQIVIDTIITNLATTLQVDKDDIGYNEAFSDYGIDSISGVHVIQSINDELNIQLDTTDIFEHSSLNKLKDFILEQYSEDILKDNQVEDNSIEVIYETIEPGDISSEEEITQTFSFNKEVVSHNTNTHKVVDSEMIQSKVEKLISEKLSQVLNVEIDEIGMQEHFSDYGIDSISGVHVIQSINDELHIELQTTDIFAYSTIETLTEYILDEFKDSLDFEEEVKDIIQEKEDYVSIEDETIYTPIKITQSMESFNDEIKRSYEPEETYRMLDEVADTDIAVIGMSGKFAQSNNIDELWKHLEHGDDLVSKVTRWDLTKYTQKEKFCNYGSFIEGIDEFEPGFFNISPLEATYMDPQQRLFLQESWSALEDAGYTNNIHDAEKCGVYVGCISGDYQGLFGDDTPPQSYWGNCSSIVPARIAYYLNLHGPAIAIDTACSSSLVAIHLACQALWSNEINMAVAGGVFVEATPSFHRLSEKANMLSVTGHCYAFDNRANGFVPGEGVGVVILKRLKDAIADHDQIYGVITGSGMNQDGSTNGITAPSATAQEKLITSVYEKFNINAENIGLVEAHGTGTKLGDPIEYNAITKSFRKYTDKKQSCAIGSIKTNLGHTGAAAGVTSLIKAILSVKNKKLVPSLCYESGNENINFEASPFYVNTELKDWRQEPNKKRYAAISSFGFSGTNVHTVVKEAPLKAKYTQVKPAYIFMLSAKTDEQLKQYAETMVKYVEEHDELEAADISFTLLIGRKHFANRLAFVYRDKEELIRILEGWLSNKQVAVYSNEVNEKKFREKAAVREEGNEYIEQTLRVIDSQTYIRLLENIAELYAQGYNLRYKELFEGSDYGRTKLPTYPFAKEHYWATGKLGEEPHNNVKVMNETPIAVSVKKESKVVRNKVSREEIVGKLKEILKDITKLPVQKIKEDTEFDEYGIDSIMVEQMNQKIEKEFGISDVTLYFKYKSIEELADYFEEAGDLYTTVDEKDITEIIEDKNQEVKKDTLEDDIAIIGLAGSYPMAENLDELWQNLKEGKDCITEIPKERWKLDGFFEAQRTKAVLNGLSYSKWGGFLKDIDCFDPLFFNISPRDAAFMDPQERIFLETAWKCFEDAGYTRQGLKGNKEGNKVGVFVGVTHNNYQLNMAEAAIEKNQRMYVANSTIYSIANRVSFVMNLNGPSLTVDTACSSSLYAISLACDSIRSKQSTMAIAGGVNLSLHPSKYITLSAGQFGAEDGRCHAFCEGGTGYVPSEAVGAVLLKPLKDAVRDGDMIYGVIKGNGVSHAGKTNGYTVPSTKGQYLAIESAVERSGINPRTITCIEAHGTGTALGDPIEITGLTDVFKKYTDEKQFCAISSIKSNIGHAEAAAGIAQLTKVLLQMKNKALVKNVMHGETLNPNINFKATPFKVQENTETWDKPIIAGKEYPRRAGISAFGAGGANAHIIVEEYDMCNKSKQQNGEGKQLVILSAKTEEALSRNAKELLGCIKQHEDMNISDIAYTLQVGREAMEKRIGIVADSIQSLEAKLEEYVAGNKEIANLYYTNDEAVEELTKEAIINLYETRQYDRILKLWVNGINVDWNLIYTEGKPNKLSLPTYSFEKEHYWIAASQDFLKGEQVVDVKQEKESIDNIAEQENKLVVFKEEWVEALRENDKRKNINNIVCFAGEEETKNTFLAVVKDANPDCKVVFVKSSMNQEAMNNILLNIKEQEKSVDAIVYLNPIEESQYENNYLDIVRLLKAIKNVSLRVNKLIVAGEFSNNVETCYQEAMIGFDRSLGLITNTKFAVVFNEITNNREYDLNKVLTHVYEELCQDNVQTVLYKDELRMIMKAKEIQIENTKYEVKENGTYVITGGCGGLGLIVAKHFAKQHKINLVLVGRSELNEEKRKEIAQIEELGTNVLYVQANVGDLEEMQNVAYHAKKCFGSVNGVVHCAGIENYRMVFEKELNDFKCIIEPKISGAINIDKAFKDESLDFVCYFSSTAAVLGDFGSCDYAIANRFLMSYAKYRMQYINNGKTFVICWPIWQDGKMNVMDKERTQMYLKSSSQVLLDTVNGLETLDKVLSQESGEQIVFLGEPNKIRQFLNITGTTPSRNIRVKEETKVKEKVSIKVIDKNLKAGNESKLKKLILNDVRRLVSEVIYLSIDKLDDNKNFADYGYDSIAFMSLAEVMTEHFNVEVTPAIFYGYSTVNQLVEHLITNEKEGMQLLYNCEDEEDKVEESSLQGEVTQEEGLEKNNILEDMIEMQEIKSSVKENDPIAIIGMSGKFAGANNIDELWDIIKSGKSMITTLPEDRFSKENIKPSWVGGFVPQVKAFDPSFFEISPREANEMDPRQRLLLEESWHALEDAAYGDSDINNEVIGMFVGAESGDYQLVSGIDVPITANHLGVMAARLSYFLNLKGTNMVISTACSSSLVALHQACLSLKNGDCDTAIVSGVNLLLAAETFESIDKARMISPTGKCAAFDNKADGMVPGEAIVSIVIKPLSKAKRDKNPIYAVIKGTGTNYDGKTNGITAPSMTAQADLLKSVYENNNINPQEIDYIVTHGTGTKLGDPIEINALKNVFTEYTSQKEFCAITSVKPNVGHAFAASGLVSLVSLVLAMKNKTIPMSINCDEENEFFKLDKSPFYINKESREWNSDHKKRLGAVSAFGMSGTNAHAVIEDYDENTVKEKQGTNPYYILTFSSKTQTALDAAINQFVQDIKNRKIQGSIEEICYTMNTGRRHFKYRNAYIIKNNTSLDELADQIKLAKVGENLYTGVVDKHFMEKKAIKRCITDLLSDCKNIKDDREKYLDTLEVLAEFYSEGYNLDWSSVFDSNINKLHMPGYVFDDKLYWVNEKKEVIAQKKEVLQETQVVQKPIIEKKEVKKEQTAITQKISGKVEVSKKDEKPKAVATVNNIVTLVTLDDIPEIDMTVIGSKVDIVKLEKINKVEPSVNTVETTEVKKETSISNQVTYDEIVDVLGKKLSEALGIELDELEQESSFIDMGVDSIVGVEWIENINNTFNINIEASMIYHYSTLEELGKYIYEIVGTNTIAIEEEPVVVEETKLEVKPENTLTDKEADIDLSKVKDVLQTKLVEVMGIEKDDLDMDTSFIDMGVDSIVGVEWIESINNTFNLNIEASTIYHYSTIDELGEYIYQELGAGSKTLEEHDVQKISTEESTAQEIAASEEQVVISEEASIDPSRNIEEIKNTLLTKLTEVMGIDDDLDMDTSFIDMGVDSIVGVEWIESINNIFNLNIEASMIYHYSTIEELAQYIEEQLN
ncbi:SDR family NAD(P)-dependent oxidoreductase [Cellulosilyticum ruminicola]|uniref:SDR family NAD(P)-dependent oxidoreductase n=1 Tax=Cellulosilyticum ruminicola TaxID=425254 RepID=UPI0006D27097|nr:SDR family NAD(P)-dependent oxidoreductase [Cellulosilyticum ruminicola]